MNPSGPICTADHQQRRSSASVRTLWTTSATRVAENKHRDSLLAHTRGCAHPLSCVALPTKRRNVFFPEFRSSRQLEAPLPLNFPAGYSVILCSTIVASIFPSSIWMRPGRAYYIFFSLEGWRCSYDATDARFLSFCTNVILWCFRSSKVCSSVEYAPLLCRCSFQEHSINSGCCNSKAVSYTHLTLPTKA